MANFITAEDFDILCSLAREFNEWSPPERTAANVRAPSDAKGERPGDEYNRRADWAAILEPHGWRVDHTSGDVTYWTRPGKTRFTSATTGKCSTEGRGDLLYVFSSNAHPFEPDMAYSKFEAHALLNYGGDYSACAAALKSEGYGRNDPSLIFPPTIAPQATGDLPDDGIQADFDFATNNDLRKYDLGIKWVWKDWLQKATVNLLAAEGGAGKTRFVLDLCRRVHLGLPWPDGTPTEAWPHQYLAMWVAGDRNHGELLENSEKFGFGERISYSGSRQDPLGGITLNTPIEFTTLYKRVKAARPLFLVIDTAGGATSFNMAKQEDARAFFVPLSDMAQRLGLCVIVITHLNGSKTVLGKRAEERVRTVIRVTSADKDPKTVRRIEIQKSNSLFPEPLGMMLGDTGSEYTDDAPPAPVPFGGDPGTQDRDQSAGPPTKVRECIDWLTDRLAERPLPVHELRDEAEAKGWAVTVLYKAKKKLDLIEAESNNRKFWGLRRD